MTTTDSVIVSVLIGAYLGNVYLLLPLQHLRDCDIEPADFFSVQFSTLKVAYTIGAHLSRTYTRSILWQLTDTVLLAALVKYYITAEEKCIILIFVGV